MERRRQRLLGVHRASRPGSTTPACARRTIADVSAVADPATGVSVYDSYGSTGGNNWYVFGGTSVAAPIIGGVYGLSADTAGSPRRSKLYAAPTGSLFDVTSGSNGRCIKRQQHRGRLPVHRCRRLRRPDRQRHAERHRRLLASSSTSGTGPEPRAGPVARPAGCAGLGWPPRLAGSHPVRLVRA